MKIVRFKNEEFNYIPEVLSKIESFMKNSP
jgi:hypothetical protein